MIGGSGEGPYVDRRWADDVGEGVNDVGGTGTQ